MALQIQFAKDATHVCVLLNLITGYYLPERREKYSAMGIIVKLICGCNCGCKRKTRTVAG
jgi:uncharacterized ion transporter superfamily protein YfcC